jgi:HNH endonuclease
MIPAGDGGSDDIENAIPVCFECHAEIHSYNDRHPRGRKFRPEELRQHKEQWLEVCRTRPEIFINTSWSSDVGPLQALIDELEFNLVVADYSKTEGLGSLFYDYQLRKAIQQGAIATLRDDLKALILNAYVPIVRANQIVRGMMAHHKRSDLRAEANDELAKLIRQAQPMILAARDALVFFLGTPS